MPCVPSGLIKVEEARQKENQRKLHEDIDFGFAVSVSEKISPLNFYDSNILFNRNIVIKSFVETDKLFESKGNEDVRLTNKNHLSNHYLYSDRNVYVHFTRPVVVEKLLENKTIEVLIYSLQDIEQYLFEYEESHKNNILAVKFLQTDFYSIIEKLSVACGIPNADFLKSFFADETLKENYKEKINALLTSDASFVYAVERFLRIIYGFNIDYFKEYDLKIVFYLLFQIMLMSD